MSTAARQKLENVGEKVGEAASGAAAKGWEGVQAVLEYQLLHLGDVEITVGGPDRRRGHVAGGAGDLAPCQARAGPLRAKAAVDRRGHAVHGLADRALPAAGDRRHVIALELIGLPVSRFAVFAGALGVGLGFGLQAIFNNFVSGLILLFDKSLKVGDFVELERARGEVRRHQHPRHPHHHQRQHRHPGAELGVRQRPGDQLDPSFDVAPAAGAVRRSPTAATRNW
jgi:hypothetical protein